MSILVDRNTRLLVQGITGREGGFHAERCEQYGTNLVAGVTPGRGGFKFLERIPVFNTVETAVRQTGANVSLIFVPAPYAAEAILEAADAGIGLVICITEGIPVLDTVGALRALAGSSTRVIGPNCPGVISPPARCKAGIMPGGIHLPGNIGVASRSGTLTYEAVNQLTAQGIGQSSCVGIGGDPVVGTTFVDALALFERDDETEAVVLIGEIGGTKEQDAAHFIKTEMSKPVAALVVGQSAPPGRRMGHAGAIITGASASASEKVRVLQDAGVTIIPSPAQIGEVVARMLKEDKP